MSNTISQFGSLAVVLSLVPGCATNQAAAPAAAVSESTEGLPAVGRTPGKSPRTSGDTLICESSRQYGTSEGNRWLWVRMFIERKPGEDTDKVSAETLVSTDAGGTEYEKAVKLAGVSIDDDRDNTLRNTAGVRTAEAKKGPRQGHKARGYTVEPNMGPIAVSCGG